MIRFLRAAVGAFLTCLTLDLATTAARAVENTWDYSVQVSSSISSSPAAITLSWPQDTNGTPSSYTVYRKAPADQSWGSGTTLAGSATSYVDTGVSVGTAYEYRIVKAAGSYTGYGYIQTGINVPLVENRGKLVLIVDNSFSSSLAGELTRLQSDLAGDGWTVLRHDVARTDSVATVKNLIKADYNADPANVKSVFLFGHIAVPYSGQFNPDGHPDHVGAWPADVYYGDVDGNWTDSSVNYTQTLNTDPVDAARISNVPGDGKFDQNDIPSNVELQVGRVDLANMPGRTVWGGPATFPSELELLRNYLNKDHNFRHRVTNYPRRAILGDYFGQRGGEAFAASGFRSFAPLVGANNVRNLNIEFNDQKGVWIPQSAQNDNLLAYACGAGSYTSMGGLGSTGQYNDGSTTEMVQNNVRGVFNLLFGSWLGDWDHEDDFLRSPLVTSNGLVAVWSGRPHWFIHAMGLGETIGYTTQLTQNNNGLYQTQINSAQHRVHIALMGDPTLRLHPVVPAGSLNGTLNGNTVALTWSASTDTNLLGYHVYRATTANGPFTRLTSSPIAANSFSDTNASSNAIYMVRAIKLESTTSGSYVNPSQGIFWTVGTVNATTTSPAVADTAPSTGSGSVTSPVPTTPSTPSAPTTAASTGSSLMTVTVPGLANLLANVPTATFASSTTTSSGSSIASVPSGSTTTTTPPTSAATNGDTLWFDDALPGGSGFGNGDTWNWIAANPTPYSGAKAHQSALVSGAHDHSFSWATPMALATGDVIYTYVYLDPANPPSSIMLSWIADNWEHRAYWGANNFTYGTDGTASRKSMGALPAKGQWVRLEVPASAVGLEGQSVTGMSFSAFDGRVTWDATGKRPASAATTPPPTTTPPSGTTSTPEFAWIDDALPAGAQGSGNVDTWNWITSNPSPVSGAKAHQSAVAAGLHEHAFTWANTTMSVATGDKLFAWVYLDPSNIPSEVMLSWVADNWEHRAYWGANKITYGTSGTAGRFYAGALPAAGQWVRLEVAASSVGLEGQTVTGMSFSTYDGRATWDKSGKGGSSTSTSDGGTIVVTIPPSSGGSTSGGTTSGGSTSGGTSSGGTTSGGSTSSGGTTTSPDDIATENAVTRLAAVDENHLRVISPTILELQRITTKDADPTPVTAWNFVDSSGNFTAPATTEFAVTVAGQPVSVKSIGFRRRVAYAPLVQRDLRIDNCLYVELNSAIADGQAVEVKNPSGALWPATMTFAATADTLRNSPAIHVNQEGYVPSFPKKAIVGYFLGSKGELDIAASTGFKLVKASDGSVVFTGTLKARAETGYTYSPQPYQKVLEADFSSYTTAGEYQVVVPGLGASLPFLINDGVAMAFTRTYALGIYHQRDGFATDYPYTRFTHIAGHTAPAEVPSPASNYAFTWTCIASKNADYASNPRHTAPQLKDEASQLYPFVNKGTVDVSGGHMDAGDYSKYTINSAQLVHELMFTADSIAGASDMDNLGLPESGDGISDIMQEAKREADYIAKLQDADGGFYFIVYPKTREYENNVDPGHGDSQVVWPKNTACTAASVAALAQMSSSPKFKAAYPVEAAAYLAKAKKGWDFLIAAIAKYGKDGSYQKITFYGDNFMHDDELAWAAAEMFAATGDTQYFAKLKEWFPNPSDPATFRWGWWRMSERWGNAIRAYAFAARSGRLSASQLDATYLAACEAQIKAAGDDALTWTSQSAYPTAFPKETKNVLSAGWYFSLDQASDMAVAYQINPRPEYLDALVGNMNYEGGTNPVNVTYLTGLGTKRQHEIVSQWKINARQSLPQIGIPLGNVQSNFDFLTNYGAQGNELAKLSFPSDDNASAVKYPFYDRWADTWNVTTEFVTVNQSRALKAVAMLAAQTSAKATAWKPASTLKINVPSTTAKVDTPITVTFDSTGLDLTNARITWEGRDQQPDFGSTFTFTPHSTGTQWVEVEVTWADGRRLFGQASFNANAPLVNFVLSAAPLGAQLSSDGGDTWNWVTSPTPQVGTKVHASAIAAGLHEHAFQYANTPLVIGTGDKLFVWVYLDPANVPDEIMLNWNDGSSWEHRAYWGADKILYGTAGTAGHYRAGDLPAAGGWVRLELPASAVGLEGKSVNGMSFSAFGGRVYWDATGKTTNMQ